MHTFVTQYGAKTFDSIALRSIFLKIMPYCECVNSYIKLLRTQGLPPSFCTSILQDILITFAIYSFSVGGGGGDSVDFKS